jgi:salicylate hydroxylase
MRGQIGAGIQMTPNVARLLRKWGVDKVIGDDLVRFRELIMRNMDGTPIGYTKIGGVEGDLGHPWWLVHR